jgi:hypothetical protein
LGSFGLMDLSPFDCVVLPANGPGFSPATTTALTDYANGGGRIVAAAEWSAFPSPISAMNGLASALGSGMSVNPANLSCGFHTTMNIDPSSFTDGVTSLVMACSSEVVVPGTAESLFRSANEGVTMAGAEQIGSGWLFLLGDSNVLSDNSDNGYTEHDNGVLAANFCGETADAEIMKDYRHTTYVSSRTTISTACSTRIRSTTSTTTVTVRSTKTRRNAQMGRATACRIRRSGRCCRRSVRTVSWSRPS